MRKHHRHPIELAMTPPRGGPIDKATKNTDITAPIVPGRFSRGMTALMIARAP